MAGSGAARIKSLAGFHAGGGLSRATPRVWANMSSSVSVDLVRHPSGRVVVRQLAKFLGGIAYMVSMLRPGRA